MGSAGRRLSRPNDHGPPDRTRPAYSEIHHDKTADIACAFWARAAAWFADRGTTCERVITGNGTCCKKRWYEVRASTGTTVKKTCPDRPQTNGKIERLRRILAEEWADIRPWHSDAERRDGYDLYVHFYNHRRAHGALGW